MMTIDEYMSLAKSRNNLASDRQLSAALGISGPTTNFWKSRRTWPSDEVMTRLATLAGQDETLALIHLNSWRSTGHAATMYLELAKRISGTAITLLFISALLPAPAFVKSADASECPENARNTLYYGK